MTIGVRAGAIGEQIAKSAFPNARIQPIRYREDTGWLAERHKYWFGGSAQEDVL